MSYKETAVAVGGKSPLFLFSGAALIYTVTVTFSLIALKDCKA